MRSVLIAPAVMDLDPSVRSVHGGEIWQEYEPPLGVLTLASVLRRDGLDPTVFDLDGFLRESLVAQYCPNDAFAQALSHLAALDAAIFGFGTICSSYPMTIRLAEQLHRLRPDARVILGGPQASVVDVTTLERFPFISAVVRGEADRIAVRAFSEIAAGGTVTTPGVTYRKGGKVIRNPDPPVVLDLDTLPPPAFDLCRYLHSVRRLPVEIGRGCPFACTFCSTNDFFRRRFRLRSPECVWTEMQRLYAAYGTTDFDLVHDMFTVDRKRVVEFCHFLLSKASHYTWHCSARTDFVDRELIQIMADAGCRSLFFGVETASPRLQKIIGKDLGIEDAALAIELANQTGIRCTVSLIVGFPEETSEDLNATGVFALSSARFDSADVQVAMLAPLSGTPLYRTWRENLIFDGLFPEQSFQSFGLDPADQSLIKKHPDLFPNFYGVPAGAGREYTSHFRWFLKFALKRCRWLAIAFSAHCKPLTQIFDLWLSWLGQTPSLHYYLSFDFAADLCRFVADRLVEENFPLDPVPMMSSYYAAMHSILKRSETPSVPPPIGVPRLSQNVFLAQFSFRPAAVIQALRDKRTLDQHCVQAATVAFRRQSDRIVDVREVSDLGAAVLRLCNLATSLSAMIEHLHSLCPDVPAAQAERFLLESLSSLEAAGLVQLPPSLESAPSAAFAAGVA